MQWVFRVQNKSHVITEGYHDGDAEGLRQCMAECAKHLQHWQMNEAEHLQPVSALVFAVYEPDEQTDYQIRACITPSVDHEEYEDPIGDWYDTSNE